MIRNRYQVVRRLGTGATGAVYEVRDAMRSGARLALKAMWPEPGDELLVATLRAELRVLAALRHPGVCRVYDFGRLPPDERLEGASPGRAGYFLTRDLVEGVDLERAAAAAGRSPGRVCGLAAAVARALDALHRAGMRHGDFKPQNAIVEPSGRPRLIDFGLATPETARRQAGTLAYMAPELFDGSAVDRRADLYALGISAYRMCTGELPSGRRNGAALVDWHRRGPRPVTDDRVPAAMLSVLERLWASGPDDRFPSASEAALALARCAAELGEDVPGDEAAVVLPTLARSAVAELERTVGPRLAGQGGAALTLLDGDPGSGRTTALTELAWRLALGGVEVVWGGAPGGGRPLGALGAALEQLAALAGRSGPAVPGEADAATAGAAAVARFLADVSGRWPLAIFIDDADDADEATLAMARFLAWGLPREARVALVCAREASPDDADVPCVTLEPASEPQVRELVRAAAGREDRDLSRRVHRHTGGNLLHVVHTLRALADRGFPPAGQLDRGTLPPGVAEQLGRALAAAPRGTRSVCEALAVLRGPANAALLAAMLDGDERQVADDADVAVDRGLLSREPGGLWRPVRPAVAQAVYEELAEPHRQWLHARVADHLAARLGPDAPEVVHHRTRAGDADAIAAHAASATRRLSRAGDPIAAAALGAAAVELSASAGRVPAELRLAAGEAARAAGDVAGVERVLEPLVTGDGERGEVGLARLILGRALDEAGEIDRAQGLLAAVCAQAPDRATRALAARELSRSYIKRGRYSDAFAAADRVLNANLSATAGTASESADLEQLAVARAFASAMLGGAEADAAAQLDDAVARAAGAHDDPLLATAAGYVAFLAFRRGDYRRARRSWRQAVAAAERSGDVVRTATLRMNLGSLAFHFGDYARCLEHHGAAAALLRAAGADTPAVVARKNFGHLLVELGAYEEAREELDAAGREAARLDLPVQRFGVEALVGLVLARTGRATEGLERLRGAARSFGELGDRRRQVDTLLDIAEVALELDDVARAVAALGEAAACAPAREDHARKARFLALRAWLDARSGDGGAARAGLAALDEALIRVRGESGRHLEWGLELAAGRALEALGDRAGADLHASRAHAILDRIAVELPPGYKTAFWSEPRRRRLRGEDVGAVQTLEVGATVMETSRRGDDRIWRLLEIYRRMSSERDVDRLLEMVMDAAVDLSGAERGFLLVRGERGSLRTAIARNLPPDTLEAMQLADSDPGAASAETLPYSRTIAERVYRTGEAVASNDPQGDPRFDQARSVHALHLESVVCVPVHSRGRVSGVLYLESRYQRVPFSEADLRLLGAFGDQVTILLDNAQLLDENVRRARDLERAHADIEALLAERTELLDRRTEELALTRRDLAAVRRRFLGDRGAFGLIGRGPAMEKVFESIERLAATDVPVLVLGDSGTGKELVARALHEHGPRRGRPMTAINCGALPESLLESELFGHERGAFTGADRTRRGLFESSDGGTLFLDEIGDTPLRMQATLLRVLQDGVIRRVGGSQDIPVDVRLVAATNRDLDALVGAGHFRADLYYRLHVVPIVLPSLHQRTEDIPLLVEHFLDVAADRTGIPRKSIAPAALRRLMRRRWPGNVRQLEHAITNAVVMADGDELAAEDFDAVLAGSQQRAAEPARQPPRQGTADPERARILSALEQCNGNKSRAARILQIPRRTFYRRLAKYGIE